MRWYTKTMSMPPFFTGYKYILGIFIAVLLVFAGWATFPFSQRAVPKLAPVVQQPIDTSAWQIYRNEELGFEMKIPDTWREYRVSIKRNQVLPNVIWAHFELPLEKPYNLAG